MKIIIIVLGICGMINFSCAQQKNGMPPKFPPAKSEQIKKIKKQTYVINLNDLELNNDKLYVWKINNQYQILDGPTNVYSQYQSTRDNNQSLMSYMYSKGEFLEGKYHGKWLFYDKIGKIIRTEKWNNGILIYSKKNEMKPSEISISDYDQDYWVCDECLNDNDTKYSTYKSIEKVKNEYFLKNGLLMNSKGIVNNLKIFFKNKNTYEFITINKGLPILRHEIQIDGAPIPTTLQILYDDKGNIKEYFKNKLKFEKGSGMLKIFYYPVWNDNLQKLNESGIKEEGEIKNNFKIGNWKYYNENGDLIKSINYIFKDSVDVRFPNCLFN